MPVSLRILIALPFAFSTATLPAAELTTTAGKKTACELVSIGEKKVEISVAGRPESVPISQILHLDFQPFSKAAPKEKTSVIELVDGTRFRTSSFKLRGKTAIVDVYGAGLKKPLELPLEQVYFMFREPDATKLFLDFQTIVRKRGKRDVMVMKKGDGLDGVEGTFGEASANGDTIEFEIAGGVKGPIRASRILGLVFNQPPEGDRPATLCKLIDRAGNSFALKSVQVEGATLKWATVTGVEVAGHDIADIARLDFSTGTMRYLSDLDPTAVVATSTNDFVERYRRDTNMDGHEIALKKEKFAKGLTLPSRTSVSFDVDGFREFRAVVGVDDELEADCRVFFQIEADGKPIYSQTVTKKDVPKAIVLGIQNIKSLRITAASELLDLGNQVSLGDARIIK